MAAITSANFTDAVQVTVASMALNMLRDALVMGDKVNRSYDVARGGDSVKVPIPPSHSAATIAQGASIVTANPNLGNATVQINRHAYVAFEIPDAALLISTPDLAAVHLAPAIHALAVDIDTQLLTLAQGLSSSVGTAEVDLTEAVIDTAETTLFNNKVPPGVPLNLIVNGNQYGVLRQLSRFSELQTVGDPSAIKNGTMGTIKDFTVSRSQLVTTTGSTPVNTHNVAFARDAFALSMMELPAHSDIRNGPDIAVVSEGSYSIRLIRSFNHGTLGQIWTADVYYGVAELRDEFGVRVLS